MSCFLHDCLILSTPEKHLWTSNLQIWLSKADFRKILKQRAEEGAGSYEGIIVISNLKEQKNPLWEEVKYLQSKTAFLEKLLEPYVRKEIIERKKMGNLT